MNKNSSHLYSKWVHPIFLTDSLPKAAWFYFNFSLIAKGANHVHHVPAAEKRLSEVKNAFNQSEASPPWGLRGCRAEVWVHKGKSHTEAWKNKAPKAAAAAMAWRDGQGYKGTERDTQGHGQHGRDSQHVLTQGKVWDCRPCRPRSQRTPGIWVDPQSSSVLTLGWTCSRLESVTTRQEMLWCHLPRSAVFVAAVAISKYYYFQFLDKVWEQKYFREVENVF